MAFETGTSTGPVDLLGKIEARAVADGWTLVRNDGQGDGDSSDQLSLSDPAAAESNQFNLIAKDGSTGGSDSNAEIQMKPSTGDGGSGADLDSHPGAPSGDRTGMGQRGSLEGFEGTSERYLLFTGQTNGGRYIHVVLEGNPGVYWHLAFGTIEKAGSFTGGQYTTGVYIDPDENNNFSEETWLFEIETGGFQTVRAQWLRGDNLFTFGANHFQKFSGLIGNKGRNTPLAALYQGGPDPAIQRTPLAPNFVPFYDRDEGDPQNDPFILLGHTPDLMQVSLEDREPGTTLTLGSDTWHLFPMHFKEGGSFDQGFTSSGTPSKTTGFQGLAYRENP